MGSESIPERTGSTKEETKENKQRETRGCEMSGLHLYLGISQVSFDTVIAPVMNDITKSGMKVDMALLKIEQNKNLSDIEKMYCSYAIGRAVGISEVTSKPYGLAQRLGLVK